MKLKKTIRKIHLWLGLSSGIIVFILGVTGCLYVFEEELRPLVYADHYKVKERASGVIPISELLTKAQDALGKSNPINSISISNKKDRSYIFRSFIDKPVKNKVWYWEGIENRKDAFVNPYSGEILKIKKSEFEFFRVVMWLHWSLLLTTPIGQPIVGIATIIFVISLITGLILWWPKNKSAAKQRFWFRWKSTTKWKRKNYDLHNILGFYSMFLVLIIALTGLVWAFDWFDNSVQWVANGGETIERTKLNIESSSSTYAINKPLDFVYQQTLKKHPKAKRYFISIPKDSTTTQTVFVKYPSRFNDIILHFDQYTGKLLKTISWKDKNNGEKINFINYDIHIGSILGLPGKILAFCLSLITASLPITGFLIWWGRKKKKKGGAKKSNHK
ncbi:PepSY domain-containing protein [Flavivirga sp. 57AJ16]|uniref:PepSY-associated TM helix domain-containing protein n=1 Tax=Flavivirga sp. 57AJ16 TaxID=3025307 RepID=UPI002366792C|nr:PepSY-associated TM helix domain-containing protein [Flavivirga sp. 57AJ16]MDD7886946.1 PepSY-associated TM helix domain-containing protein [Flavivirga sp. 57AJ16]